MDATSLADRADCAALSRHVLTPKAFAAAAQDIAAVRAENLSRSFGRSQAGRSVVGQEQTIAPATPVVVRDTMILARLIRSSGTARGFDINNAPIRDIRGIG